MIKNMLENKIENCYTKNKSLKKYLNIKYDDNFNYNIMLELNDFILSNNDIYESNNFTDLIYESFYELDDYRFTVFLRNLLTENPNRNRTYAHMLNDIKEKLNTTYELPKSYYNKSKTELNDICDQLFSEGKFNLLSNTRKYIKENFRIDNYQSFIFENRDLAKKILKQKGEDDNDLDYIRIKKMLEHNPNYLGLFIYYNKIEKINFGRLKTLYNKLLAYKDILRKLPDRPTTYMDIDHKGSYKGKDGRTYPTHFEELEDNLRQIKEEHTAKLFADEYPAHLRYNLAKNSDFIEIIKELTNKTDDAKDKLEMYRRFWIRKVSRYKNQQDLLNSLENFVFSDSSSEKIREKINSDSGLKMVFDDGDVIVCRVLSYDAIQNIGSDTSWCIKDSLSYWTDYVNGDNVQLVIMDLTAPKTSPERKIGCTLYSDGSMSTAHLINDSYISENDLNELLEKKALVKLKELFDIAKDLGNNVYYDSSEINSDSYGRW
jgi:hypothetical protein